MPASTRLRNQARQRSRTAEGINRKRPCMLVIPCGSGESYSKLKLISWSGQVLFYAFFKRRTTDALRSSRTASLPIHRADALFDVAGALQRTMQLHSVQHC